MQIDVRLGRAASFKVELMKKVSWHENVIDSGMSNNLYQYGSKTSQATWFVLKG